MAKGKKVGVHGTDEETGRGKEPGSKTVCPITRGQFRSGAKTIMLQIGSQQVIASPKEFSTGSLGWWAGDKVVLEVDGQLVKCQLGFNLTVIGSKDLPAE